VNEIEENPSVVEGALEVSIVIPVFNEEENVPILYEELARAARQFGPCEILFVDDCSTDRTVEELRAICARDNRVKTVLFARNAGQTAALQAGFDHARAPVVVTLDGDLQNDPADIPRLLAEIEAGFDVVCGWREKRQDKWLSRRIPSEAANALIKVLTGVDIHDHGCTLKAFRKELLDRARFYSEMHRFILPILSLSGVRYKEISVNHRERRFGEAKYGLSRIWKVSLDLLSLKMILRFISHPAAWFAVMSIPFGLVTLLSVAASVLLYAAGGGAQNVSIILPSIAVLFAFLSCHLLVLGLVAELVVKVGDYRESGPLKLEVLS
jgi:glycosyltransferase involved in cell wall biosynthesis